MEHTDYKYRPAKRSRIRDGTVKRREDHADGFTCSNEVVKASDRMVSAGQLSTEFLRATQAREKARTERNDDGRIVQKYGEIYGDVARRQIAKDKEEEREVINMRFKKKQEKWEADQAKAFIKANN